MKINEKHLISFATGSAAVDKQGYLSKRGEVNKSFQRRWFVLKGNLLYYFDKKTDSEPLGIIVVEGCSIELSDNSEKFAFELNFMGSGARTYVLAAESQEEMAVWMRALTCATYDYLRNAVSDLQRQVNLLATAAAEDEQPAVDHYGDAVSADHPEFVPIRAVQRLNPFNGNGNEAIPDVFPAGLLEASEKVRRPRTFEEMHYDFGERILLELEKNQ